MAKIIFDQIYKYYGQAKEVLAVESFNLTVEDGEFVALIGPSGCGKSSALRMVAGLETIDSGNLFINDKCVNDLATEDRNIAMAFENYALYPPINVYENIAFPLKAKKGSNQEIKRKVHEIVELFGIAGILDRRPEQLSGGQCQQVSLARALIKDTDIYLLDEPISHLDVRVRDLMKVMIKRIQSDNRRTTILVTHNQLEALQMADRICVMNEGKLMQFGTPQDIYDNPANLFVANFIGEPPMNFLQGDVKEQDGDIGFTNGQWFIPLKPFHIEKIKKCSNRHNIILGIRPAYMEATDDMKNATMVGKVNYIENLGEMTVIHLGLGTDIVLVETRMDVSFEPDDIVGLNLRDDKICLFDKSTGLAI